MKNLPVVLIILTFLLSGCGSVPASTDPKEPYVVEDDTVSVSVTAVGDCTFGTDINYISEHCFTSLYDRIGGDSSYFFKNVKKYFENDDLTLVNFEGTLSENGERQEKEYAFRGKPEYAKILTAASIEGANLSNNHTMDYGEVAFSDTKKILSDNGITWFSGRDYAIKDINGIKTAIIGVNFLRGEEKQFADVLEEVKTHEPKLIIASIHWGIEKNDIPEPEQIEFAHMAIDNGVDLVLGHHPHVLQGIEKYRDRYIVYSLGNFCFGGSVNPADKDTMIFKQTFGFEDGMLIPEDNVYVIPCSISSIGEHNNFQPTPLESKAYDRVREKIIERSNVFSGIENIKFVK